ncbi:hypothetical protein J7W08_06705 [Methanococcoides orientis]|uniref:hypothetical protein n=1 Tax=Methanococcoides orientis TaxID=2822137 RepID=UPI001E626CBA|nr:hypothetical protein [Methanococcoides orientis]UGV39821.1 hypothetical protein J7W08_06705 [Methanococcoides orientis]
MNEYNDLKYLQNDIDFEEEVIQYLSEHGYARRELLIATLMKSHTKPDSNGYERIEAGYSKPTINRKLTRMVKEKTILSLDYNELQRYRFPETDKRSSCLILPKTLKLKQHLDSLFTGLESKNDLYKKMVLKDLDRYGDQYILDSNQLDSLLNIFDSKDDELVDRLLNLLYQYVIDKEIKPLDEDNFLFALKSLLKRYPITPNGYSMLRRRILQLLAYYKDKTIIDQLVEDTKDDDVFNSVKDGYNHELIYPIIEEFNTQLFNLEFELRSEGKKDQAKFISELRDKALNFIDDKTETQPRGLA